MGPVSAGTLEAAYRAHARELTVFAAGLVGTSDAADVVATAMARVVAGGRWTSICHPRAYLYQAVYREAVSLRRRLGRQARQAERVRGSFYPPSGPPVEPVDEDLVAAVRQLPVRQRAVIVLTYWQDLGPEEVAERLGVSTGAVKKHLARGRESVRRAIS